MHLSFVAMEVMAALNEDPERDGNLAIQCALLHDVIEDTDMTYEAVKAEFGKQVAQGVLALTKDTTLEKPLQMPDSLRRIRQQPPEIWMVKLADRISNLAPPPYYWTKVKIRGYREEAIEIQTALHKASRLLAERLQEKIEAYKAYA
jgi:(p)ppGpp synthase/HD superfamily hydrolase